MTHNPIQPIRTILADGDENLLHQLGKKCLQLEQLQKWVSLHLADPLNNHCCVANFRDGCLILKVDSAAFATQLRYKTGDLLNALRTIPALCGLRSISHYINPKENEATPRQLHVHHNLSDQNAKLLLDLAANVEDESLKKALRSLAKHSNL